MAKQAYRTTAGHYYMPSANATAPAFHEADGQVVQKKTASVKKHRPSVILAQNLRKMLALFLLSIVIVGQYAYIQSLGYDVSVAQANLSAIQSGNEKLKEQYAASGDLRGIELYAMDKLGMIKPEEKVAYYLSLPQAPQSNQVQSASIDAGLGQANKNNKFVAMLGELLAE